MKTSGEYQGEISAMHPALAGHFVGNPITPGVVLLNQVSLAFDGWSPNARIYAWPLVKFVSPLRPDESFNIRFSFGADNTARFSLAAGTRTVASGQCRFEVRP